MSKYSDYIFLLNKIAAPPAAKPVPRFKPPNINTLPKNRRINTTNITSKPTRFSGKDKITFDESGKPIIPRSFLKEDGTPKDPLALKQSVLEAFKANKIKELKALDKSKNIELLQQNLKAHIQRSLLIEKFKSPLVSRSLKVIGALAILSFLFSGKKPTSKNPDVIEFIDQPLYDTKIINAAELAKNLNTFADQVSNETIKQKLKKLASILTRLSAMNVDLTNKETASKYAKVITYVDNSITSVVYDLDANNISGEPVNDLKKYMLLIQSMREV